MNKSGGDEVKRGKWQQCWVFLFVCLMMSKQRVSSFGGCISACENQGWGSLRFTARGLGLGSDHLLVQGSMKPIIEPEAHNNSKISDMSNNTFLRQVNVAWFAAYDPPPPSTTMKWIYSHMFHRITFTLYSSRTDWKTKLCLLHQPMQHFHNLKWSVNFSFYKT